MLVERGHALESLRNATQQAAEGHGLVVIVGGEAGIGKTTLLRAFCNRVPAGAHVHWGSCEALYTPRPLGPLHDMAAGLDRKLAALLDEGAPQARLFPALLAALQNASGTPVLVFEDVHWADAATLDLIKYLGRRIALLQVVLVLSLRSDDIEPTHPLALVLGDLPSGSARRIDLQPLSKEGVALLADEAGQDPGDLYRVTRGNPFFVSELLQHRRADVSNLPSSIRDAVWSRLARLDVTERELVETLSIIPGNVEAWLANTLLKGMPASALTHGLVERDRNGDYRFRHELARLAALQRLSPASQEALHARALDAMIRHGDVSLSRLVHHAAGAGNAAKVLEFAPKAAAEAANLGAHQQAAAHLATALRFVRDAPLPLAAELYETWSYEAGIALKIDESIIEARHKAIALWRQLGRTDRVGHNLRWLSRLHWYRGEAQQASDLVEQAVLELETAPPDAELAMAYSARSQLHMLNDRTDEAITWGRKAIALAEQFDAIETRVHALNNVASALLFSGREGGEALMEESLALALQHGLHEQAARAYTNYSEYAVLFRKFPLAERLLAEGIAFDTRNDLDAWTHYLVGRQAQLRMDQGRFREAETIAKGVLSIDRLTLVMHLPAATVLGRTRVRMGEADGRKILQSALKDALATGENQNITPVRLALAESYWLAGELEPCRDELRAVAALGVETFDPWERGELATMWVRARVAEAFPHPEIALAPPWRLALDDRHREAADAWSLLGLPYEAGLALADSEDGADLARAVKIFQTIGARPAEVMVRRKAQALKVADMLPRQRRGPYAASRSHPLGLTARESEVLRCIAEGLSNRDIAHKFTRSQRTIENQVSAVLGKLNASNRFEVFLRLRNEPWLLDDEA